MDAEKAMSEDKKYVLTQNQRAELYEQQLLPLKAKISQIMIYDTEMAQELLGEYNSIIKHAEISGLEIFKRIIALENKIEEYQKNEGKTKESHEQTKNILTDIRKILSGKENFSKEDLQEEYRRIKEGYEASVENFLYTDRELIEPQIASLQAEILMRRVREGETPVLVEEISEREAVSLQIYINEKIYQFIQSDSQRLKKAGNELKYHAMERQDAVYDLATWQMIDDAQTGKDREEELQPEAFRRPEPTDLAVVSYEEKTSVFSRLFQKRLKVQDLEMDLTKAVQIGNQVLKVKDLARIDLEWLASQASEEFLRQTEIERLQAEGRQKREIYEPDAKEPIYDFFEEEEKRKASPYFYYREKSENGGFGDYFGPNMNVQGPSLTIMTYYNQQGIRMQIEEHPAIGRSGKDSVIYLTGDGGSSIKGRIYKTRLIHDNHDIIAYARLIDKMTNSNLYQSLLNELGTFIELLLVQDGEYVFDLKMKRMLNKLPIFSNLKESYERVAEQTKLTKVAFRNEEENRRNHFYETTGFKDRLSIESDVLAEQENIPIEAQQNQVRGVNAIGTERTEE